MNHEVLEGQLQHHWAGAAAGTSLFKRVGRTHGVPDAAAEIADLAGEISEDRESLRRIMVAVGVTPSQVGATIGRLGQELGRLKPNGRVFSRSPLTDVLELEALCTAVAGKRYGWRVLRALADHDERLDPDQLDHLTARADKQLSRLEDLHQRVAVIRVQG